ncbi:MAG: terminase, partial [Betaproteobacteria bacterium]|nr:terminase [Betaproteobacteria bacterium]
MSETSFAREYMCDFSAAGDDQLISLSDVEAASKRVLTERDVSYAPKIIGVDPARFGDDRSVIFKRQGLQALNPSVYRGIDNMDLAARVASLIQEWE